MTVRRLRFFDVRRNNPFVESRMILMENDGTEIVSFLSPRWFRRIEREGRRFLIAGADRETGELVYLPEVELV